MLYPTYTVNGVPMLDPHGRWHEHPEMQILPAHPGLRATSIAVAGVGGELLLPQAPLEPQDFVLRMYVNAVDEDGKIPSTIAERLVVLHANTTELLRIFQISDMTQGQGAVIERHLSDEKKHVAHGHLIASVEVEREPHADYAELRFVFRLPFGVWRGDLINERVDGAANGFQYIWALGNSTAPIDGPHLVLTGPFDYLQVTNQHGNGFRFDRALTAGQAVTLNPNRWSASEPYPVEGDALLQPAGHPMHYSSHLSLVGQVSGTALTLLPQAEGAILSVGGTGRVSGSTYVHVYTTEAYL